MLKCEMKGFQIQFLEIPACVIWWTAKGPVLIDLNCRIQHWNA